METKKEHEMYPSIVICTPPRLSQTVNTRLTLVLKSLAYTDILSPGECPMLPGRNI